MTPDARAYLFLALLIAFAFGALAWSYWRGRMTPFQMMLAFGAGLFSRLLWRTNVPRGKLRPGHHRGAVIISNHRSSIDPFFLQAATDEQVSWLVAKEYVRHPAFAWFLNGAEAIATRRSGIDIDATKKAIERAAAGRMVGMFPEGRINRTDELLLPVRPGPIYVALKARVPIVPCWIEGAPYAGTPWSPFFMAARVTIRVGEPIDLSEAYGRERDGKLVRELLVRCVRAMAALAGQPDYEPTIAGRDWMPPPATKPKAAAANGRS